MLPRRVSLDVAAAPAVAAALLPRRLLPPLPGRAVVPALAGAICVNLAMSFASSVVELRLLYEPYDAARRLGGP